MLPVRRRFSANFFWPLRRFCWAWRTKPLISSEQPSGTWKQTRRSKAWEKKLPGCTRFLIPGRRRKNFFPGSQDGRP